MVEIIITALIGATAGAVVAYPLGRQKERRDVQREAAKNIDLELAAIDESLQPGEDWSVVYNNVLSIPNRHVFALRHDEIETRLNALTSLLYALWSDLEDNQAAIGRGRSYVRQAIRSVRNGIADLLHHKRLQPASFPTGEALDNDLAVWREDGLPPREWLEPKE